MESITLPSKAVLKITPAPFPVARALYQVVLEEAKPVPFNSKREMGEVIKDLTCAVLSSKKVEAALWECMKRVTYNDGKTGDLKVTEETFEPLDARQDYLKVMLEVAKVNIMPFMKSLSAEYGALLSELVTDQA